MIPANADSDPFYFNNVNASSKNHLVLFSVSSAFVI